MLGHGPSVIRNAPEVGDVDITAAMLESVGFHVGRDGRARSRSPPVNEVRPKVPEAFTGLNRIPILMLGPLLHRAGEAFVPLVGGDPIGRRPVDFHLEALTALGAEIEPRPHRDHRQGHRPARRPHHPAVPERRRDRDRAPVGRAGRRQDGAPERGDRARGGGARAFPAADGRQDRAQPGPPDRHRGRRAAEGRVHQARRGPPRGILLPGRGAHHPGARCGCTAARRTAWSPRSPRSRGWAPGSTSPTSGSPRRRRTGCGPPPCTPTPTRVS